MAPRRLPRVGPGTVYRNLKALVDEGRIREVRSADEAVRYHGNTGEHHEVEVRGVCPACPRASLSQPELFARAS